MSTAQLKRVCLGQPGYSSEKPSPEFLRPSLCERAARPLNVRQQFNGGSLLAQNFNALWCWALNTDHCGDKVDYFAMLHCDVEPVGWWLDDLIEELEAKDLDVLSVVIPIKNGKGITSTALDRPGDTWSPLCRLTMKEAFNLPETFTAEDVGHPLLLNTGCWVCRFDPAWRTRVHFTINDRIVFDRQRDKYLCQVEPEDWCFSRQLNEMGLKIGATRKIQVDHPGRASYTNKNPWGTEVFDAAYVERSAIPDAPYATGGFRFPHDVAGWLLPEEGHALAELARDKYVLEIGSYCGKSTVCLAQTARHVHAIDPHDGRGTPAPRNTRCDMLGNLARYQVTDSVTISHPDEVKQLWDYDLVFIDGAHDASSVRADIELAKSVLKPGGLIAFHDYRTRPGQHDAGWDPGVTEAVDEFVSAGAEIVSTHATLAVLRPPAPIPLEV